jgi:hypothetical protein
MPFKKALDGIVDAAGGGVGAILVDDEGESIDYVTRGDSYEIRLAGAHHGIVLAILNDIQKRIDNNETIEVICIRSDLLTYTIAILEDGLFIVLAQDKTGIPARGMKALREGIPVINKLI